MKGNIKDYHKTLGYLHVGTEEPHAYFIPFKKEDDIFSERENSSYFTSLIGEWDFKYYPSVALVPDLTSEEVNFKETISVPKNWQMELDRGYDVPSYNNVRYPYPVDPPHTPDDNPAGLYRRYLSISEDDIKEKDLMITFEVVDSCFYLFINKRFVGYSQVSHRLSEFKVNNYLIPGENEIKVLVLKWCDGSYLEDQDMYRMSGIFREVYLVARDKVRIEDIFLKPELKRDLSEGTLPCEIKTNGKLDLKYTLLDKDGNKKLEGEICIDGTETVNLGKIDSPDLWSTEIPNLYSLMINAGDEVIKFNVGFRKIDVLGKVVYINGQKVKLLGANRHDSHPVFGHWTPIDHVKNDLMIMKAHNMNTVRTSHYPNDPRFYDMCDKYGFYVVDEADCECHGMGNFLYDTPLTTSPDWSEAYVQRAKLLLERDKNHPSIIMWSVGNECGAGLNNELMAKYYKMRDPSRLVHSEEDSRMARLAEDDRAAGKPVPEWVDPEHYRSYTDVESRMYPSVTEIEDTYLNNPNITRPFFLCEYCHAMGNGPGDLLDYQELIDKYDSFLGGCIWEFTDHSVAVGDINNNPHFLYGGDFGEYPHDGNFCVDGLVYPDRRAHTGLLEAKAVYKPFSFDYNDGVITVKSKRYFKNLSDLTLSYTVERFGTIIAEGDLGAMDIEPGAMRDYKIVLPDLSGLTTLNLSAKQKESTEWAAAGYTVGEAQFILSEAKLKKAYSSPLTLQETEESYTVNFGSTVVTLDRSRGLISSVKKDGKTLINSLITPTFLRAPTDNDRNVRLVWIDKFHIDRLNTRLSYIEAKKENGEARITAHLTVAAPADMPFAELIVDYVFRGTDIEIKTDVTMKNAPDYLPRFGYEFTLDESFSDISYLGYGPMESYEDKRRAARLSFFETTVDENFEHYVKPQENGAHYGTRIAKVASPDDSIIISSDSFSFSASPYSSLEIMNTAHDFELKKTGKTVINVDYRNSAIGSNSCGPKLMEKYRFDEKEFSFSFRLKLCDKTAFSLEKEF